MTKPRIAVAIRLEGIDWVTATHKSGNLRTFRGVSETSTLAKLLTLGHKKKTSVVLVQVVPHSNDLSAIVDAGRDFQFPARIGRDQAVQVSKAVRFFPYEGVVSIRERAKRSDDYVAIADSSGLARVLSREIQLGKFPVCVKVCLGECLNHYVP